MREFLLLTIFVALSACQPNADTGDLAGKAEPSPPWGSDCVAPQVVATGVAIEQITGSPARFEGVLVRTSGYYARDFEHSAIYATLEADPYDHKFASGIWLDRMDPTLSGKHVEITGQFTQAFKGHLGQWPGSICVISATVTSQGAP
ncbi:hypothetical protein GCM10023332_24330 [Luteimonas vadosa]|uniref:Lipoprotein n=1 Tax=Luteimonas vadosa TaxID=1165507 RepID=A0ABP9EAK4_9GAMM